MYVCLIPVSFDAYTSHT